MDGAPENLVDLQAVAKDQWTRIMAANSGAWQGLPKAYNGR